MGIEDYAIGMKLGYGQYATTYLASGNGTGVTTSGHLYSMKIVDDDPTVVRSMIEYAKAEVEMLQKIKLLFHNTTGGSDTSPNVLKLVDSFISIGSPISYISPTTDRMETLSNPQSLIIVTEHVAGVDLSTLLEQGTPCSIMFLEQLLEQMLTALRALHGTGIAHRDVKADNIIFTPIIVDDEHESSKFTLIDFGDAIDGSTLYKSSTRAGTYGYINSRLTMLYINNMFGTLEDYQRGDFFALGVVLYTLMERDEPFAVYEDTDDGLHYHDFTKFNPLDLCVGVDFDIGNEDHLSRLNRLKNITTKMLMEQPV